MWQSIFFVFVTSLTGILAAKLYPLNLNVENPTEIYFSHDEILPPFRLPGSTVPESYDISIRTWIHEANFTFTGHVRIGIRAVQSTDFITLHQRGLSIQNITILSHDNVAMDIDDPTYHTEYELLTIPIVRTNLTEGSRYFIDIDYIGTIGRFSGFFQAFYYLDGVQHWYATTQFEHTDARRAFPCYDEPALKANFTITITHDSSYSAISNMPAISEDPLVNPDGSITTIFQRSPKMSTYLVAFHISDFSYRANPPDRNIPHRAFARPNAINQTALVLEFGERVLDKLSDFIGIEYALPKMDHDVPIGNGKLWHDNIHVNMEQEQFFFYNENVDSFELKKDIMNVVSHEAAHQWFGNLVTPSWWSWLWLKEGFATFFEYLGLDLAYPDWQMMDMFNWEIKYPAMAYDENVAAYPMTRDVAHPSEIFFLYNYVAYYKAGSVLRMFYYMFGEETFMEAVRDYLQTHAHSDADEEDLFESLQKFVQLKEGIIPTDTDVATIMSSWSRQPGFPLITVERNYVGATSQVTLRQKRYITYGESNSNLTWWVPYNFATAKNPGFENVKVEGWMPQNTSSFEIIIDSLDADDYLVMNKRASGYYRVIYDERNYRLISDAIIKNHSLFPSTNIAQLLIDAKNFIDHDLLPYPPLLDLLRVMEFDVSHVSWSAAFGAFSALNQNFRGHRSFSIWEEFMLNLMKNLYEEVGIEDISDESLPRKRIRQDLIRYACQLGNVHCLSDTNRQLRQLVDNGQEFHRNIDEVKTCASLRSANRNDFHFMWNRAMSSSYPREFYVRSHVLLGLTCSSSRQLLSELLRTTLNSTNTDNFVYSGYERSQILYGITTNTQIGLDIALEFFIENAVEAFHAYDGFSHYTFSYLVRDANQIERYHVLLNILLNEDLITQEDINTVELAIERSLHWLATHGEAVHQWLMENYAGI
ncbi:aminopeptidase N-like [Bradysia coprophila]|uniref:aminopeptidase N-like n=1 Tax=Bradysia coprophila TaxID=38358 RepID=UPI00187DC786|nr:aminopeptidase N-like [Bradysia coprophila]